MGIETVFAEGAKRSKLHKRGHGRLGQGFTICGMKIEETYSPKDVSGGVACLICSRPENRNKQSTVAKFPNSAQEFDPSNKMLSELVAIRLAIHDLVDELRIARGVPERGD